jgi:nicotinamidase-related amidase
MRDVGIIDRKKCALVIVDVQEKFRPVIFEIERVVDNAKKLIEGAKILGIPIIVTEQYPKGLGCTVNEIKSLLEEYKPIEKLSFSCFGEESFIETLEKLGVTDLIIFGIEAHVCITKTILDAISRGYRVHLVTDAVSSRSEYNWKIAIERARQAGAFLVSTEMILFQLMDSAGTEEFKRISKIIK